MLYEVITFKLLENVKHGSDRINSFILQLKDFSQPIDRNREEWIDLKSLIEKVLYLFRADLAERVKTFIKNIPENLPQVWFDPSALEQILINLLINA